MESYPSILSYLHDPELPPLLIENFFRAAFDYADARPWTRLEARSAFPILLSFEATAPPVRRMAMILGGEHSGGDVQGLVLCDELPEPEVGTYAVPALTVLFAGSPDPELDLTWRGRPLPRSRTGLLAWPTVHEGIDRVRAPRRSELLMMTLGLRSVRVFLATYPSALLDDGAVCPHRIEVDIDGLPGRTRVRASSASWT